MLLFGGSLSGPAAKRNAAAAAAASDGRGATHSKDAHGDDATALASPRTDVLHRLTNHELRLLEELERTRATLQAEWRHKLADAGVSSDSNANAVVEQLAQQLGLPSPIAAARIESDANAAVTRSKPFARKSNQNNSASDSPLRHKPAPSPSRVMATRSDMTGGAAVTRASLEVRSLPLLQTSMDMLPVLTSTGETPFEVGLDSPTQHQHVLPIFRLPTVNAAATASALAAKAVETVEDDREQQQASEALGLSVEEIAIFEAELNGDNNRGRPLQQTSSSSSSLQSDDRRLPGLRLHPQSQLQANGVGSRRATKRKTHKNSTGELTPTRRSDGLRRELESALVSVQHLTRLVKDDLVLAQKICPANALRTSLYFKRWGRDKVETIFRRLLFSLQGMAFARWRDIVAREKQNEKLQAYLMYKGSKKLDQFLLDWSQRKLRQAWTKWSSDIAHVKAIERLALELDAIRVLQRAWRGYCGRTFAALVKAQRMFAEQTAAARTIQRQFRGSVTRKFVRLKQLSKRQHRAATTIQAVGRGYLARQLAKHLRRERTRYNAARTIQALQRGRITRRALRGLQRTHRVTRAAVLIQRRYRGRLGRVKFMRRQIERYRAKAATTIQRIARGRIAKRIVHDRRAAAAHRRALEHKCAIEIQRVYRGHRSRLSTELKLIALREKNRWRAKAATRIQTKMRSCLAKAAVARRREAFVAQLVQLARTWVEYWNEDTSSWFYYNQGTGEAIWAPPPSGYTKADGNLVLQTGKVIADPADNDLSALVRDRKKPSLSDTNGSDGASTSNAAHQNDAGAADANDDNDDDDDDRLCVECEEEDARRRCEQCEDVFCDACFEKLHRSSKREKHTWKAIGSLRCIECEKMKATRWCYVCQDPYCLGCFTIIHAKGNKVAHDWTDMATFKRAAKQQHHQQQQQRQQHGRAFAAAEDESAQTYDEYVQSHEYAYVTALDADETAPASDDAFASATAVTTTEWMTLVDDASGQTYYYNTYTGESRWA